MIIWKKLALGAVGFSCAFTGYTFPAPSASAQCYGPGYGYYYPAPRRYYRRGGFGFGISINIPTRTFQRTPTVRYGQWQQAGRTRQKPSALVRDVQSRLSALGYPVGEIDGYYGPNTANALRQFQGDAGIPVTGKINDETVAALGAQGAPSANSGATAPPPNTSQPARQNRPASEPPRSQNDVVDLDENFPNGIVVPGKDGYVKSPYAKDQGLVDVRGYPAGTLVRCPYTNKIFVVPG